MSKTYVRWIDGSRSWSDPTLIAVDDDADDVPSLAGYLGAVDVLANRAATAATKCGAAEFDGLAGSNAAPQGSGIACRAATRSRRGRPSPRAAARSRPT